MLCSIYKYSHHFQVNQGPVPKADECDSNHGGIMCNYLPTNLVSVPGNDSTLKSNHPVFKQTLVEHEDFQKAFCFQSTSESKTSGLPETKNHKGW